MASVEICLPDTRDVLAARERLSGLVRRTPVLCCAALDLLAGGIFCKAECLQVTGSFKVRGALNKVRSLSAAELARGLVAVSTGNAAVGAAYAAREAGARVIVVMPETSLPEKIAAVRTLGGRIENDGIAAAAAFARAPSSAKRTATRLFIPSTTPT